MSKDNCPVCMEVRISDCYRVWVTGDSSIKTTYQAINYAHNQLILSQPIMELSMVEDRDKLDWKVYG